MEGVLKMTEEVKEQEVEETKDTEQEVDNQEPEAKYTDEDVNKIVSQKFAKWQREKDEAIEEAKKLEKMNKEQRDEHERQKLEEELAEYKRKDQFYSLSREATNMLHEHGITANDELLGMIVKDTAEDTQTAVNSFVTLFNTKVEEGVKQALSGKSPKVHAKNEKVISAEEFKNMTYPEKVQLKNDNPEMYNKIIKE